jgi:hypothetical protein
MRRTHASRSEAEQSRKPEGGWSGASAVVGLLQSALHMQFQHEIMRALALLIRVMLLLLLLLLLLPPHAAAASHCCRGSASSRLFPQRCTASLSGFPAAESVARFNCRCRFSSLTTSLTLSLHLKLKISIRLSLRLFPRPKDGWPGARPRSRQASLPFSPAPSSMQRTKGPA